MLPIFHEHEHLMTMPGMCRFSCVRASSVNIIKTASIRTLPYKIGISMKNWVRECLDSVDMWRMGPIMSWFALGFVMSNAFFEDFFSVCA